MYVCVNALRNYTHVILPSYLGMHAVNDLLHHSILDLIYMELRMIEALLIKGYISEHIK